MLAFAELSQLSPAQNPEPAIERLEQAIAAAGLESRRLIGAALWFLASLALVLAFMLGVVLPIPYVWLPWAAYATGANLAYRATAWWRLRRRARQACRSALRGLDRCRTRRILDCLRSHYHSLVNLLRSTHNGLTRRLEQFAGWPQPDIDPGTEDNLAECDVESPLLGPDPLLRPLPDYSRLRRLVQEHYAGQFDHSNGETLAGRVDAARIQALAGYIAGAVSEIRDPARGLVHDDARECLARHSRLWQWLHPERDTLQIQLARPLAFCLGKLIDTRQAEVTHRTLHWLAPKALAANPTHAPLTQTEDVHACLHRVEPGAARIWRPRKLIDERRSSRL